MRSPMRLNSLLLIGSIGTVALLGAGCINRSGTVNAPIAAQPAATTTTPSQPVTQTIAYDHLSDGIGDYTLPASIAQQVIAIQNCTPFNTLGKKQVYLPVNLRKSFLCHASKRGEDTVVTVIGQGVPYESYPFLASMVLVLEKDKFTVTPDTVPELRTISEREWKAYPNGDDFGTPEFAKSYTTLEKIFSTMLQEPSNELQKLYIKFKADNK